VKTEESHTSLTSLEIDFQHFDSLTNEESTSLVSR